MKTILTTIFLAGATAFTGQAQALEENLTPTCAQLDTAKTLEQVMKASSAFDISAMRWPKEYITNYYAAYSKAIVSYYEPDVKKKDQILDQADKFFEKAKAINAESDETYVLAALLANARMAVDGANRWQKYGKIFDENLEKAKAINADNPRIYYLRGTSTFYTPKMFGGGKKKALPYFEKAKELYEKQDSNSVLKPIWGAPQNTYYIDQCNGDDKD